jgi:hypothetical protein
MPDRLRRDGSQPQPPPHTVSMQRLPRGKKMSNYYRRKRVWYSSENPKYPMRFNRNPSEIPDWAMKYLLWALAICLAAATFVCAVAL